MGLILPLGSKRSSCLPPFSAITALENNSSWAKKTGDTFKMSTEPGAEEAFVGSDHIVSLDGAASDGGDENDLDDEAAEARLQALTARLEEVGASVCSGAVQSRVCVPRATCRAPRPASRVPRPAPPSHVVHDGPLRGWQVVGALSETEEANVLLKEEIKQLLAEQDEQDELRNELHEQLHERSELMQLMARQTVTDSMASSDMLDRIRQLREEAEAEKQTFQAEMEEMGKQLQTLEANDAETQERLGPLDDVD